MGFSNKNGNTDETLNTLWMKTSPKIMERIENGRRVRLERRGDGYERISRQNSKGKWYSRKRPQKSGSPFDDAVDIFSL